MVNVLVGSVMNLHVGKVSAFERKSAELCKQRFYYASVKLHDRVSVVRRLVIALLVMDALFWNRAVYAQSHRRTTVPAITNDVNSITYQKCRDKVAVLSGPAGKGTGFLCQMDGRKWLVTNSHVADQDGNIKVSFLDGRTFKISNNTPMEEDENRDLVRFEMPDAKDVLQIAEDVPDIGTPIEFYGNADGGDVITMTAGKILSVGLDKIEIDAKIQRGNSGSPLVRVCDGKVIGVTTCSKPNTADDPSKIGTRFDPTVSATREFAVRFTGVKWLPTKYENFLYKISARNEVFRFKRLVEIFCFNDEDLVLEYKLPNINFKNVPSLKRCLLPVSKEDMKLRRLRDKFNMMCEKSKEVERGRIESYSFLDFENSIKSIKRQTVACYQVRGRMMRDFARIVGLIDLQENDKDFMLKVLDEYIRKYEDNHRQHLKGFDLPNIPENPFADMRQQKRRKHVKWSVWMP